MNAPKTFPGVMLSSTFTDLKDHRQKAIEALLRADLHPVAMEYSVPKPDRDVIESSLQMVRDAAYYVLIIGHKYGQIPEDRDLNPKGLSITELEYDEAIRLERPVVVYVMADEHIVPKGDVERNADKQAKLEAFTEKAKRNGATGKVQVVYAPFKSVENFAEQFASGTKWLEKHAPVSVALKRPPPQKSEAARIMPLGDLGVAPGKLFGRGAEEAMLQRAVASCAPGADPAAKTDFVVLHAFGGAGKTALMRRLVAVLKPNFAPFEAVIGWSAYLQGSHDNANTDAKAFIDEAIAFLGHKGPAPDSERRSGEVLAGLMRETKTLLLLDGIEPLQHSPLVNDGFLKDPALAALIKNLAIGHPGLVVITSRQPLPELAGETETAVVHWSLDCLAADDGAALLKHLGCHGTAKELRAAVGEVLGHALSLTLLGTYITEVEGGDIAKRDHLGFAAMIRNGEDRGQAEPIALYARRTAAMLKGYIRRFEEEAAHSPTTGAIERTLLYITGLFKRPATGDEVRLLLYDDGIPGLTDSLSALPAHNRHDQVARAAKRLRKLGLLTGQTPKDPDGLDAPSFIRDHFAQALKSEAPETLRQAHERLYRYYASLVPDLPDTVVEMQPLFQAVNHACAAELYQEALDNIYRRRILRGGEHYLVNNLGAYAANLGVLAHFFDRIWDTPHQGLSPNDRVWLLNCAGAALRAVSRLSEAESAHAAALEMAVAQEAWQDAAIAASNVSEMRLSLGRIGDAVAIVRRAVDLAERAGDAFRMMAYRAALANALAQSGDFAAARDLFIDAEHRQAQVQPEYPRLYSIQGYRYCDLLLSLGCAAEVADRSAYALAVATRNHWVLDIGINTLSGARAEAALASTREENRSALAALDRAVDALLKADSSEFIPSGYLARAAHLRRMGEFSKAAADLRGVLDFAVRGGMRLFLTDYHLESARLALAQIAGARAEKRIPLDPPPETPPPPDPEPRTHPFDLAEQALLADAAKNSDQATALIAATGYHRRDLELADLRDNIAWLQNVSEGVTPSETSRLDIRTLEKYEDDEFLSRIIESRYIEIVERIKLLPITWSLKNLSLEILHYVLNHCANNNEISIKGICSFLKIEKLNLNIMIALKILSSVEVNALIPKCFVVDRHGIKYKLNFLDLERGRKFGLIEQDGSIIDGKDFENYAYPYFSLSTYVTGKNK